MTTLHLSFDFPDQIDQAKTKAVYNLVNCGKFENNVVISLNRTANPFSNFKIKKNLNCYSCKIYGLPYGIGLYFWMYLSYRKILRIIKKENIEIKLIHAHKLSYEGIIANFLSSQINVPYIVSVRGDTDIKIIKYKKLYYNLFQKVLIESRKIIFIAPWTLKYINTKFRNRELLSKSTILPNIIEPIPLKKTVDNVEFPNRFITVFNLNSYKRKNIKRIIEAFNHIHNDYPDLGLDIVGGGDIGSKAIKKYITKCKYPYQFKMLGEKSHLEVLRSYQNYLGFILPSFPETFGLVFVEALHSGIPIIYSENSGIDGYFDKWRVGKKVKYNCIEEIEKAITEIYNSNSQYRESIKLGIESGEIDKFSKNHVKNLYCKIIDESLIQN